ncbi:hypothetical protein HX800_31620, partial [Pseudomonas gingeri]|nr:hypothetical protein [Pseudomonas gingeri]
TIHRARKQVLKKFNVGARPSGPPARR